MVASGAYSANIDCTDLNIYTGGIRAARVQQAREWLGTPSHNICYARAVSHPTICDKQYLLTLTCLVPPPLCAAECGCVLPCACLRVSTGAGGNNLLGNKEQVKDQELSRVNRHMLVNWALGLPVRFFRRNDDGDSDTKSSLIYDGLYYVVSLSCMRLCSKSIGWGLRAEVSGFSGCVLHYECSVPTAGKGVSVIACALFPTPR